MKKALIATTLVLALASTATAAPRHRHMQAPIPQDKAFTIEGIHNYTSGEGGLANTSGIRLGIDLYKPAASRSFYHQFCANLGYATAEEWTYIPLTVGYNANTALTDKITFYAGAKLGLMKMENDPQGGQSDDTNGFMASLGAGLKFKFTENAHVQLGYEIGKVRPSDDEKAWGESFNMRTLSLGIGIKF